MLTITTLKDREDFLRLRRGGKFMTPFFIVRHLPMPADIATPTAARVGYTVTTKCGNAVVRNRTKRRLRALVREFFPAHAKPGHDYVLIALADVKPAAHEVPFATLRETMHRAITGMHR